MKPLPEVCVCVGGGVIEWVDSKWSNGGIGWMGSVAGWILVNVVIGDMSYYRPQRSCEGYVFTGVCLFTGGGVVS